MSIDITITVNLSYSENSDDDKNLCYGVIDLSSDDGLGVVDNTDTKNEQIYTIAALRDLADAMEGELNRPENTRSHIESES